MDKQNFKIVVINLFSNLDKEKLLILTLALIFKKDIEDVLMIDVDIYCLVCQLKKTQIFAIHIKDHKFLAEKKARLGTNSKTVILEKYYNSLKVFLKKNLNTLFFSQKYDYKYILKKKQEKSYAFLYKILLQKLNSVKPYLNSHLAKKFI